MVCGPAAATPERKSVLSADEYRFCQRCQKLRKRSDFVPMPVAGRKPWIKECCRFCADALIENQRRIDPKKLAITA